MSLDTARTSACATAGIGVTGGKDLRRIRLKLQFCRSPNDIGLTLNGCLTASATRSRSFNVVLKDAPRERLSCWMRSSRSSSNVIVILTLMIYFFSLLPTIRLAR